MNTTTWRSTKEGYTSSLASSGFLQEETRVLLKTYARLGDAQATCQALADGALYQRTRSTRESIMRVLRRRFLRWNPPAWVLTDLLALERTPGHEAFRLSLLLHLARQDRLLYDFVQSVVVPHWRSGDLFLIRSHVQGFLDSAEEHHPNIREWTQSTREKLSNNVLAVLCDGMILRDGREKRIAAPLIPEAAARHLIRLLGAEGVVPEQMAQHPDWNLWLCDTESIRNSMKQVSGSYFDRGYEPGLGTHVWILASPTRESLEEMPMPGVIVRRFNIDEKELGNTYFDITLSDGSGRTFHLPINQVFDHEPKLTEFKDRLGSFHRWA